MLIYLACPYTHHDKKIMQERFESSCEAAAALLDKGKVVFAPISHGHLLYGYMQNPTNCPRFWLNQCFYTLTASSAVYVLGIDGWDKSRGVRWELETALAFNIPVYLVDLDGNVVKPLNKDNVDWKIE